MATTLTDVAHASVDPLRIWSGGSKSAPATNGGLPTGYLDAFVAKYPIARQSWSEAVAAGDKRDFGQWLTGHANAFPQSDYARELTAFKANPVEATNALNQWKDATVKASADQLAAEPDWDEYLARPDVAAYWQKVQDVGVEKFDDKYDFAQSYYTNIGKPNGNHPKTKGQTGNLAPNGQATQTGVPAEQALYTNILNDYVLPDMKSDAERQKEAAALKAQYDPAFKSQNQLITDMTTTGTGPGSKLYDMELGEFNKAADAQQAALNAEVAAKNAALADQTSAYRTNLGAYTTAQNTNLAAELAARGINIDNLDSAQKAALSEQLMKLHAAQDPLNAERINAARSQMTGINLGLQSVNDQIAAQTAADGYAGGASTATDMALARAAIGARQNAAGVMGQAKVANATDNRDIDSYGAKQGYANTTDIAGKKYDLGNYGATQTRGIADSNAKGLYDIGNFGADQTRTIADYGSSETRGIAGNRATGQFGLFTGDVQRRLSALSLPSQALQQQLNTNKMLDEYGQTGLNRGLNTLGFFNTSGVSNPYANALSTQPNGVLGSTMSNLGAGLVNMGGSIAMNNWLNNKQAGTGTAGPNNTYTWWGKNGSSVTQGPITVAPDSPGP